MQLVLIQMTAQDFLGSEEEVSRVRDELRERLNHIVGATHIHEDETSYSFILVLQFLKDEDPEILRKHVESLPGVSSARLLEAERTKWGLGEVRGSVGGWQLAE